MNSISAPTRVSSNHYFIQYKPLTCYPDRGHEAAQAQPCPGRAASCRPPDVVQDVLRGRLPAG
jgi:hypothetical protein